MSIGMVDTLPVGSNTLPQGWKRVRLGDVCSVVSKGATPTSYGHSYTKTGVPFLRAEDVIGSAVDHNSVAFHISNETHDFLQRSQLKPYDMLVTIAGTLGRIGYIPELVPPMNCNQAVCFARPIPELLYAPYGCYCLRSEDIIAPFLALKAGGAIQNLNLEQVRSILVPLPPLPEQKRIAAILNEQMMVVETARAACEAQLEAAKALPAAYLRTVFESDEAKKWEWKKLGDVALRISKGESPGWQGFEYINEGPLFVRSENVLWGSFKCSPAMHIPQAFHKKLKRSQLRKNDVLVNLVGASIGRACKVPVDVGEANVNQAVGVITLSDCLSPDFLMYYVLSDEIQKHFAEVQVEMARPNISLQNLRDMFVPVPNRTQQDNIAMRIMNNITNARDVICTIEAQLGALNQYAPAILRKAFRGEL